MSAGGVRGAKLLVADCSPGAETESRIIGPLASPVDAERCERVRGAFVRACTPLEGGVEIRDWKIVCRTIIRLFHGNFRVMAACRENEEAEDARLTLKTGCFLLEARCCIICAYTLWGAVISLLS